MKSRGIIVLLSLTCYAAVVGAVNGPQEDCVRRQEFDVLKQGFDMLQSDLHYWQNTTLSLIKEYTLDRKKEDQCPLVTDLSDGQDLIEQKLDTILLSLNSSTTMMPTSFPLGTFLNPAASCKNIPTSRPSGNYWIQSTSTGYATMEYCHMSPPCSCSRASGWMRVADLDMTDPQEHCPPGFRTITSPKRMCGRPSGPGCASVTFPVNGVHYSRVCGRVNSYQYNHMDAFNPYFSNRSRTIDDIYVDGTSLTHGHSPRQHIWTFANALDETVSNRYVCPCTKTDSTYTGVVPPFIGNDYFCDTGSHYRYQDQWYTQDSLWDGEGCRGSSTCCEFNDPPWFCRDLPQPTTDDVELRMCSDERNDREEGGIEIIRLYIQ